MNTARYIRYHQLVISGYTLVGLWMFLMQSYWREVWARRSNFNIGKSKANLYDKDVKVNITFDDVAGLDEAKEEVKEVVDFLKKNPKKNTRH